MGAEMEREPPVAPVGVRAAAIAFGASTLSMYVDLPRQWLAGVPIMWRDIAIVAVNLAITCVITYGLWTVRRWAFIVTVLLLGLGFAASVTEMFGRGVSGLVVPYLLVDVVILALLLQHRTAFTAAATRAARTGTA